MLAWGVLIFFMIGWSALALFAYVVADPVLAWFGASLTGALANGQGVVEALGGKAAGEAVKALEAGGIAGQILTLAQAVAKPVIVIVWGLGMVLLAAAPSLLLIVGRLLKARS